MGEKLPRILPKVATSMSRLGSFTCRKFTTWDRRLYFPSERWRAEASAGFDPANSSTRGQHAYLQTTEAATLNILRCKFKSPIQVVVLTQRVIFFQLCMTNFTRNFYACSRQYMLFAQPICRRRCCPRRAVVCTRKRTRIHSYLRKVQQPLFVTKTKYA